MLLEWRTVLVFLEVGHMNLVANGPPSAKNGKIFYVFVFMPKFLVLKPRTTKEKKLLTFLSHLLYLIIM